MTHEMVDSVVKGDERCEVSYHHYVPVLKGFTSGRRKTLVSPLLT